MSDFDKARKDQYLQDRYSHLMAKKTRLHYEMNRKRIAYEDAARAYQQVCRDVHSLIDELNETFKKEGMVL